MIQITAPRGPLEEMLLLELQGKIVIPPKLLEEERARQGAVVAAKGNLAQHSNVAGEKRLRQDNGDVTNHSNIGNNSGSDINNNSADGAAVVEVPLGRVTWDPRNETRCSLRIGAVEVNGTSGKRREPLLVLRRRVVGGKCRVEESAALQQHSSRGGPQCCLLQEWLQEHPEELTLDASVESATIPKKVYELVGVAERYVHLNSKPIRRPE